MFNGLDTLGQDTKTAGLCKRNHSAEKLATLVVLIEEASVDFYDVARQPLKVTEIGMASAEIIDPQLRLAAGDPDASVFYSSVPGARRAARFSSTRLRMTSNASF